VSEYLACETKMYKKCGLECLEEDDHSEEVGVAGIILKKHEAKHEGNSACEEGLWSMVAVSGNCLHAADMLSHDELKTETVTRMRDLQVRKQGC
jgi:hypothetical protein